MVECWGQLPDIVTSRFDRKRDIDSAVGVSHLSVSELAVLELVAFSFLNSTNLVGSVSSVFDAILSEIFFFSFSGALRIIVLICLDNLWSGASSDLLPLVVASALTLRSASEDFLSTEDGAFL